MASDFKLDFYIKNNLNVLMKGRHGTGKTTMIKEAFERAGLKYKYFSASTMDPWVDFVGVPRPTVDPVTGKEYLDLIRPREFANDEIEALFFDEYSRASKKVRNAVMELIQFKSINGKKFNNLKIVWAAINPDDDSDCTYDVEKLDPAQEDRFHVILEIPYKPSAKYFNEKFGDALAKPALEWWLQLPAEAKKLVSPRRLDYALTMYQNSGDIRDVINGKGVNVSDLTKLLSTGSVVTILERFFKNQDVAGATGYLLNVNNSLSAIPYLVKKQDWLSFFLPLFGKEALVGILGNNKIFEAVISNHKKYADLLYSVWDANTSSLHDNIEVALLKKGVDIKKLSPSKTPVTVKSPATPAGAKNDLDENVAIKKMQDILDDQNFFQVYYKEKLLKYMVHRTTCYPMSLGMAKAVLELLLKCTKTMQKRTITKFAVKISKITSCCLQTIEKEEHLKPQDSYTKYTAVTTIVDQLNSVGTKVF